MDNDSLFQRQIDDHDIKINRHASLIQQQHDALVQHQKDEKAWRDAMIHSQNENTEALNKLSDTFAKSTKANKEMLDAWTAANGAVKVGRAFGKFVKWLGGISIIFVMGLNYWHSTIDKLSHLLK